MANPLVSVIIPTYNCKDFVAESVFSALNQSYKNLEIIVVDDSSTDGTFEKIKEIQKKEKNRISILSTKKNSGGPAKPRNLGIQKSKGELIAFLDGDDLWHEKKIEKQVEYYRNFLKNNERGQNFFCHAGYQEYYIDRKSGLVKRGNKKIFSKNQNYDRILKNDFIGTLTVILHRKIFKTFGLFRDDLYFQKTLEDYEYWLRIISKGVQINYIPEILAYYNIRQNSVVDRSTMQHSTRNLAMIMEHIANSDQMAIKPQLRIIVRHLWYYIKSYIKYKISK